MHTDSADKNVSSELVKEYLSQSYKLLGNMMPIISEYEFIPAAGIIMERDENELIFAGYGYRAYLNTVNPGKQLDFLSLEKGFFDEEANWVNYMDLNGDEQHIQMEEKVTILKAVFYEF